MTSDHARIPKGLAATRSFPVVHVGEVPTFDSNTWDLHVTGAVGRPLRFTWQEFEELPRSVCDMDFFCVQGFARLSNRFEGVPLRDLLHRAGVRPAGRFVRFTDGRQYDTTIPLEPALGGRVLLADTHDGRPLTPEHGGPLRVVVPERFAYKSCKWVRSIEILEKDKPGYWESRGWSNGADPWMPPK